MSYNRTRGLFRAWISVSIFYVLISSFLIYHDARDFYQRLDFKAVECSYQENALGKAVPSNDPWAVVDLLCNEKIKRQQIWGAVSSKIGYILIPPVLLLLALILGQWTIRGFKND